MKNPYDVFFRWKLIKYFASVFFSLLFLLLSLEKQISSNLINLAHIPKINAEKWPFSDYGLKLRNNKCATIFQTSQAWLNI